jgi:hypothetical protein
MDAIRAALEPADDDGPLGQVDVIPAQIAGFGNPQTVAVDNQPDEPIPMTVPVALEGDQQPFDLGLGQVLPDPVGIVPPPSFCATGRLRTILVCRSRRILPDISAPLHGRLIA